MMRKIAILTALLLLASSLMACGVSGESAAPEKQSGEQTEETPEETREETTITLWTYPVGSWGNETTVSRIVTDFCRKYPEYKVDVECLDYETGDSHIKEAMEAGNLPDLVLEGPERLVAKIGRAHV